MTKPRGFVLFDMHCHKCHTMRKFTEEYRILYCEVCEAENFSRITGQEQVLPKIVQPSQLCLLP